MEPPKEKNSKVDTIHTVDGRDPAPVEAVVYPAIYKVYVSQMVQKFFHQQ